MQRAGPGSWRITVDNGKALNAACYVRDVAGVPLDDDPSVPPRLMQLRVGAPSPVAIGAAPAWRRWWLALMSTPRIDLRRGSSPATRETERTQDAEESEGGDASAALTALLDQLQVDAATWSNDLAGFHPVPSLPPYAPVEDLQRRQELHRQVAEEVIRDYAVTADRVAAHVELIWSDEPWAHQPARGALVCSVATWTDERAYRSALTSTFERGLARS
jgi:hypothetical protein